MPASPFNQYNVPVLQPSGHPLRSDFARLLARRFGEAKLALVGLTSAQPGAQALICESVAALAATPAPGLDTVLWFFPHTNGSDAEDVAGLAAAVNEIVLLPGRGSDVAKRRPELVERFRAFGFAPDYDFDLAEFDSGALRLVRGVKVNADFVPAVETAFARLNERVRGLERSLRTRMSELEAADRHIAKLEEKVLSLKEAKRALKQLKEEKQALRKSAERKVGQVILAPYLLPQKLFREVKKRVQPATKAPAQTVTSASEYQAWLARHSATANDLQRMRAAAEAFEFQPLISIIMPVFNTPPDWLEAAIDSIIAQAWPHWELILIDDGSSNEATLEALPRLAQKDARLRLERLGKAGGISVASNRGLAVARGEWIALVDHDDVLEPDAFFHFAQLLQTERNADLIYSDEDKLTEQGPDAPIFKPDWSPDFFLSYNYIVHLSCIRRELVEQVGGFRAEFDGAQDYDLLLRLIEITDRIHHIPRVLYHWRRSTTSTSDNIRRKPKALEAGKKAIDEHLVRIGQPGYVAVDWRTHAYHVKREIIQPHRVCIIIPARDNIPLLARCIDSLVTHTSYENYEIVIVDNDSETAEARDYFASTPHRLLHYSGPFNFSAINNLAVEQTTCPWLLFLNNDVEVIDSEWLTAMVEHVQRPEVGAVGARLLYPDNTIQHAGVVLGVGGIAQHAFRGFPAEDPGVCRQLQVMRNYSSVTAACLLTRREVFLEVGGFDEEQLPVTFNDVDLCLKMRRAGYLVVYTPFARLYHHESATRRRSVEARETEVVRERWPDLLARDPYYNPNLSRERADFSLGV